MERKKRSKGRGWESCCVKKIYGTFGVEMRAYGQKLVKFCKHTDASKLVVEIWEIRGKLTTKTWNSMNMKIDRCQKTSHSVI